MLLILRIQLFLFNLFLRSGILRESLREGSTKQSTKEQERISLILRESFVDLLEDCFNSEDENQSRDNIVQEARMQEDYCSSF